LQRVRIFPKEDKIHHRDLIPKDIQHAVSALHWACQNGAPLQAIREIAAAGLNMAEVAPIGPNMAKFLWDCQGIPLEFLLNKRNYYFKPELMEQVKALSRCGCRCSFCWYCSG
jgi:hypothetical protein